MTRKILSAPELLLRLATGQPRIAIGASGLAALVLARAAAAILLHQSI